jgi:hypothetical protein
MSFRRLVTCTILAIALSPAAEIAIFAPLAPAARADDAQSDAEKQAAQERKERFTKWMRTYAEGTHVRLQGKDETEQLPAELVANPIFRYTDDLRAIPDATLWVWTRDARPVALQKVEGNNHGGGQAWTICFASLSEELLEARWPSGRRYTARKPGLAFSPIPKSDVPAEKGPARRAQIKSLKDRFTARINVDDEGKVGAETRMIATPVFEYSEPSSKLPLGAIFGLTATTTTNPDLLLVIEARPDGAGKFRWEFAHVRMTSNAVVMRLDGDEVWSEPNVPVNNPVFDNWTFYFLPRDFK